MGRTLPTKTSRGKQLQRRRGRTVIVKNNAPLIRRESSDDNSASSESSDDKKDNEDSSSTSSSSSSSSDDSSTSESSNGSDIKTNTLEPSETTNPSSASVNNVCDWICEGCAGEKPGSQLVLKQCQHPGGQCEKFIHHLCAVNWAVAHNIEEPGNTCRQHTAGYKQSQVEKQQRILDQCHVLPDTEALSEHRALPSETGQILMSSSAQLIYHGVFTSFPRHAKATDSDVKDAKTAISKMRVLKITDPPRNAHIIERNLEVLSWSKPLQKKLIIS